VTIRPDQHGAATVRDNSRELRKGIIEGSYRFPATTAWWSLSRSASMGRGSGKMKMLLTTTLDGH